MPGDRGVAAPDNPTRRGSRALKSAGDNDAFSSPGQPHPRTALPERDSLGDVAELVDAMSMVLLIHSPAIRPSEARADESGLSGTHCWEQRPGSNPGVLHHDASGEMPGVSCGVIWEA